MRNFSTILLFMAFFTAFSFVGCKKKDTPKPISELILKTWKASEVKVAGTKVYDSKSSTNTQDYSKFRLSFTNATDVVLTEANGDVISGKWALTNNNTTLVLSSLNPQPTGVTGDLTYTNLSVTETELKMTRSTANPKTGASSADYVLF
jgi:hypothetical protein